MSIEDFVTEFENYIENVGGSSRGIKHYIIRNNTEERAFIAGGAYFGCIAEGQERTGQYSDLSIVVFPNKREIAEDDKWLICLIVGSNGFKNDYDIVSIPWARRLFSRVLKESFNDSSYVKHDFLDIESKEGFETYYSLNQDWFSDNLIVSKDKYEKVILACTLFYPSDDEYKRVVFKYLSIYSKIRNWKTNIQQRASVERNLGINTVSNDEEEIRGLLEKRKYIVLQGAPGTGKTFTAKNLVADVNRENVFFTQFHAETTYSDFVYGIYPDVNSSTLNYKRREGVFISAIRRAQDTDEKVYLIIDEINRANLSNVLGPAFYLFEPTMSDGDVNIEITPDLNLSKLPGNLYVIATMNTADRSLAVVDFALRRRFAWYTMRPHTIQFGRTDNLCFCDDEFNSIAAIFEKYATDEELNLQPGQAYFIVNRDSEEDMRLRMKYEIMPLIKEYLMDGMLVKAKDEFVNYFRNEIGEEMFQ